MILSFEFPFEKTLFASKLGPCRYRIPFTYVHMYMQLVEALCGGMYMV